MLDDGTRSGQQLPGGPLVVANSPIIPENLVLARRAREPTSVARSADNVKKPALRRLIEEAKGLT
jgi:hypothetical protein